MDLLFDLAKVTSSNTDNDALGHTRSDWAIRLLLDSDSGIRDWFDLDSLTKTIFILDGEVHLNFFSKLNRPKLYLRWHNINTPLHSIMQHRRHHRVSLINQLRECLLLVNCLKNHLMLTLLSHLLDVGGVDVLAVGHGGDLYSSVSYAFGCDELLVELGLSLRFLGGFYERHILSKLSIDIEIFCFDDMMLLSLEDFLLL